ncbi:MAG: tRNA epoxyqueuosine(34) reductase QueG [bacterium]|nr:tRNA epoxyqueuosine(34) reductase QueG [bacterium]
MKGELQRIAMDHGCAGFGVTTADEFAGVAAAMNDRNETGFSGRRRFTYKDPGRAADVRSSFPWATSLVTVSWSYLPEAGSPGPDSPGTARIARFATVDHYEGLRRAVSAIRDELAAAGFRSEALVDDDRLVDRAAAVRAGIAWWGKSTMVLDPRHGPWLLLGSVVTDAHLEPDMPMRRDCGRCDACLPACPTGAIVAPGVLDASRCLAHWLQTAGVFPRELRVPLGDRVYGCDDCLDACPPGQKQLAEVVEGVGRIELLEFLAADDETLLNLYSHFFIPRRRPRILRRNAIMALANTLAAADGSLDRESEVLDVLAGYLNGSDELLRLHAAWAIGRIGGGRAGVMLAARETVERVPQVREEIGAAIAGLRFSEST